MQRHITVLPRPTSAIRTNLRAIYETGSNQALAFFAALCAIVARGRTDEQRYLARPFTRPCFTGQPITSPTQSTPQIPDRTRRLGGIPSPFSPAPYLGTLHITFGK